MKFLATLLGLLLIVSLNLTALAQDEEDEGKDVLEVAVYGGLSIPGSGFSDWSDSLGAKTGWVAGVDVGYFLTPSVVVGLNLSYAQYEIDTDMESLTQNHRLYNPMAYLKYYFWGESNLVPYVRGLVGLYNPKFSTVVTDADGSNRRFRELSYDPALAVGIGAGVFYYISDFSGLYFEAGYQQAFTESAEGELSPNNKYEFGENIGVIDVHAGIIAFFGTY